MGGLKVGKTSENSIKYAGVWFGLLHSRLNIFAAASNDNENHKNLVMATKSFDRATYELQRTTYYVCRYFHLVVAAEKS